MKKNTIITLIVLFLNIVSGYAQNFKLNELTDLIRTDKSDVIKTLSKKKWKLEESEKPTDFSLGKLVYSFKNSDAKFTFFYSGIEKSRKRLTILRIDPKYYDQYTSELASSGYKLYNQKEIKTEGIDESIKIYRNEKTTIQFGKAIYLVNYEGETLTHYYFMVFDNEDYDENIK